ncbi:amino acid permease-domain-containing protein [Trametes punicea]|nr:amino acid permease-domain-containing protein [Trametes punicea]
MATLPAVSPAASSSWSSAIESKGVIVDDNLEKAPLPIDSDSVHNASEQAMWKRILVGNASAENNTKRAMKSRHLTMIAIGGTIGTGIFLSAGSAIAVAGPASALFSYFIVGIFCYAVVISLGEMAAYIPVSGTFAVFGTRFFSPALGFTLGMFSAFLLPLTFLTLLSKGGTTGCNGPYTLLLPSAVVCTHARHSPPCRSLSIPSELTAAAVILQFWDPRITAWQWALIIVIPIFAMQLIHVRVYGESEYWFAMIKVLMIIVFIFVGLIYDWGGVHGRPGPGLANFRDGQAFVGGLSAFAQTFVFAFYSYGGVELVSLAAGESASPHKSVPRAIRATFFRIVIFYILTILTIGLNINYQDPTLLSAADDSNVAASPITVVFQRAGFGAAAHVINAVLLTAVLSATNSCFYASSRMLLSMAREGHAPSIFGWVNGRGVPVPALVLSLAVSFVTFLTTIWGEGVVFTWLLDLTGISSLLVWGTIGIISLRFRAAWRAQGRSLQDLPYRQPFFPILPIATVILSILMFAAQGYSAVVQTPFSPQNIVATYIGLVVYIACYIGYWIYERLWLKQTTHLVPLLDVDLDTDAVWKSGDGLRMREKEAEERAQRDADDIAQGKRTRVMLRRIGRYVA